MVQLRLGLPAIIMIAAGTIITFTVDGGDYGPSLGQLIGACICFSGIITGIVGAILWFRGVHKVELNPRVVINPPSNKSSTVEDIIVICPNCDEEVNVGTDEDDLYECPHCSEEFEF